MPIDDTENQRRLEEHLAHCREVFATDEVSRAWREVGDGGVRGAPQSSIPRDKRPAPSRGQDEVVARGGRSDLLTVVETAEYLRVSVSAIRRLQQRRCIAFIKIGGSVRFARADLAAYVAKQRVKPIEQ